MQVSKNVQIGALIMYLINSFVPIEGTLQKLFCCGSGCLLLADIEYTCSLGILMPYYLPCLPITFWCCKSANHANIPNSIQFLKLPWQNTNQHSISHFFNIILGYRGGMRNNFTSNVLGCSTWLITCKHLQFGYLALGISYLLPVASL